MYMCVCIGICTCMFMFMCVCVCVCVCVYVQNCSYIITVASELSVTQLIENLPVSGSVPSQQYDTYAYTMST